jgi:tricorn protease
MMRKSTILLASILLLAAQLQGQEAIFFADHPTLSPDGSTVIFSYESDLWTASTSGNAPATRLTAMDGDENNPVISPNGKWLVFASNQFGNNDLYIMPTGGGAIRQLTYHQASDVPASWSWDNETIYFTSNRENRMTTLSMSTKGG